MISVITPTNAFNEGHILDAYSSIAKQDAVFEWNIQVDGDKQLASKIAAILPEDNRVNIRYNGEACGPAVTRNYAIMYSKYDIVRNLDIDDFFLDNAFKSILEYMTPDVGLCMSPIKLFYNDDLVETGAQADFFAPGKYLPKQLDGPWRTGINFGFACNTLAIRRDIALSLGGYYHTIGTEDLLMVIMAAEKYACYILPEATIAYRIHRNQFIQTENIDWTYRDRQLLSEMLKIIRNETDLETVKPVEQPNYFLTIKPD